MRPRLPGCASRFVRTQFSAQKQHQILLIFRSKLMLQCKPAAGQRRGIVLTLALAVMAAVFPTLAAAATNGLGQKPYMGWSSWSSFHKGINEGLIRSEADAMAAQLKPFGYTYINMDSGWTTKNFDSNGRPTWDTSKFPSGIPALATYV